MKLIRFCLDYKFAVLALLLVPILSCEKKEDIASVSKLNSPPLISSVVITPEKPNKESVLHTTIQCQDPDGDPISLRYQWIKNDVEMLTEKDSILKSGSFRKGDYIKVKVVASDGKTEGTPFVSSPVEIVNSPPIIQQVWIEPKIAFANTRLEIHAEASDPDGDSINYIYQWEKNGKALPEEKSEFLEPGLFKKGDAIIARVTPDDREILGLLRKTEPVMIGNGPPIIVSSPPTGIKGAKYLYQVKTIDPDDDRVTYILKSNPKGMEIDQEKGLIQWEIKNGDKGNHEVEIEVSDPEGTKGFQKFALFIEIR